MQQTGRTLTALGATLWIQSVVAWAMYTVPVFAPTAAGDLGIAASKVGYFAGFAYIGAMTGALLGGGAVPRFGAIAISQAGMALCALGLMGMIAGWWPVLILAALVLGFGYGPTTPASSHVLARHTPPRLMTLVFSIKQTGVPLGGALAGATVPHLTEAFGWRGAAVTVASICLLSVILVWPTRRSMDADRNPGEPILRGSPLAPLRFVLGRADLRELALTSIVFAATQQCLGVFLVVYLTGELGLSLVAAGLVLAVSQAAGVFGRILWGWVADKPGQGRRMLGALALGMAISSVVLALCGKDWPIATIAVVGAAYGATGVGWNGVLLAEVARLATLSEASRATGGTLFVTFFGVVVGPPLFGEVARLTGTLSTMFLALGLLTAICALVLLRGPRR